MRKPPGFRSVECTSASQLSGSATVPFAVLIVRSSGPIGSLSQSSPDPIGAAGLMKSVCHRLSNVPSCRDVRGVPKGSIGADAPHPSHMWAGVQQLGT
jgi:hypothetical protein